MFQGTCSAKYTLKNGCTVSKFGKCCCKHPPDISATRYISVETLSPQKGRQKHLKQASSVGRRCQSRAAGSWCSSQAVIDVAGVP